MIFLWVLFFMFFINFLAFYDFVFILFNQIFFVLYQIFMVWEGLGSAMQEPIGAWRLVSVDFGYGYPPKNCAKEQRFGEEMGCRVSFCGRKGTITPAAPIPTARQTMMPPLMTPHWKCQSSHNPAVMNPNYRNPNLSNLKANPQYRSLYWPHSSLSRCQTGGCVECGSRGRSSAWTCPPHAGAGWPTHWGAAGWMQRKWASIPTSKSELAPINLQTGLK